MLDENLAKKGSVRGLPLITHLLLQGFLLVFLFLCQKNQKIWFLLRQTELFRHHRYYRSRNILAPPIVNDLYDDCYVYVYV